MTLDDKARLIGIVGAPTRWGRGTSQICATRRLSLLALRCRGKRGNSRQRLGGTLRNDTQRVHCQKEWLFPPEPSLWLITDTIAYCAKQAPTWHPISISG